MDTKCRDHLQVNSAHRKPSSRCDKKFKLNTHKKKFLFFKEILVQPYCLKILQKPLMKN